MNRGAGHGGQLAPRPAIFNQAMPSNNNKIEISENTGGNDKIPMLIISKFNMNLPIYSTATSRPTTT